MAATQNFADALQALVAHRDDMFLTRIAQDYNLNLEELKGKYHETCGGAFKVPKKREAKVKVVKEGEEPTKKCCATTAKKEQCKFSCLHGEVFCKRHLNASQKEPKPAKEPKVKKTKKVKEVPMHTHKMDGGVHSDCELCKSHGASMDSPAPALAPAPAPAEEPEEDYDADLAAIEEELAEEEPETPRARPPLFEDDSDREEEDSDSSDLEEE
jgi:hypothetical protein